MNDLKKKSPPNTNNSRLIMLPSFVLCYSNISLLNQRFLKSLVTHTNYTAGIGEGYGKYWVREAVERKLRSGEGLLFGQLNFICPTAV
jgi:hypothetical protein